MGIVGGREKVGISEVETWDMERFKQLVTGPKMKWLWQGKQKPIELFAKTTDELHGRIFSTDDQGGYIWTGKSDAINDPTLERTDTISSTQGAEVRSGLGRIKGAVGGLKSHREDHHHEAGENQVPPVSQMTTSEQPTTPDPTGHAADPSRFSLDTALAEAPVTPQKQQQQHEPKRPTRQSLESYRSHRELLRPPPPAESPRKKKIRMDMAQLREEFKADIYQNFSAAFKYDGPRSNALQRSQSAVQMIAPGPLGADFPRQNRLNRQLSFSIVENSVLAFDDPFAGEEHRSKSEKGNVAAAMAQREALAAAAQKRSRRILHIQRALLPFTESKVDNVLNLDRIAQRHLEELNNLYYQKLEEYQTLRATSSDVVGQEKGTLTESLRRVEMLGAKLDYELNALQSRMQEVEDGVAEFERSVIAIEGRVKELAGDDQEESYGWFQRLMNVLSLK
jgi:hypothetical protein